MSDLNIQQGTPSFSNILRDLSIELQSKDLDEMRLLLLAFDRVDEVLASLQEEDGIQVRRRADVVEAYTRSREGLEEPVTYHTLDYTVRKYNVELQLEVRLEPPGGFGLELDTVEQYRRILGANSKTQEILLVWATEELDSVALDLDGVLHWKQRAQPVQIAEERLRPLKETIRAVFEKHRPILQRPTDIRDMQRIEFDLAEAFSRALGEKIGELREGAKRKKIPEKKLAIRSISDADEKRIQQLFLDSQVRDLESEELTVRIEKICENIDLKHDAQ